MSLRHRLSLLIGALILAVISLYAALAYGALRSTATTEAGGRTARASAQLAQILGTSAERTRTGLGRIATRPEFAAFLTRGVPEADSVVGILTDQAQGLDVASRFFELLDARGRFALGVAGAPFSIDPVLARGLASRAAAAGGAVVGALHAEPTGIYFPVMAPVRGPSSAGEPAGYLIGWYRIDHDAASQSSIAGLIGRSAMFYVANLEGDVWTDLAEPVDSPRVALERALSTPVQYTSDGRTWRIASATPVEGTDWAAVVTLSMSDVLGPARKTLRTLILVGAFVLLISILAAVVLSSAINRPLESLVDAAQALGEGRNVEEVPTPRWAELATVARAFNSMAERVRNARKELESRIEETEASEARLRQTQERLRHVIASTNAVIYERDASSVEGRLTWISENVSRLLGYEPDDALAPGWWQEGTHPDDRKVLRDWVANPEPGVSAREYRFRHNDGTYRWIRDERRCVVAEDGRTVEVVGAWLDVTAAHHLEQQLRQAQKLEAVGRLAGGVAHDFNNVLTVILAETEVAQEMADDPALVRSLDAILSASNSAAMLTRQLLTFSRQSLLAVRPLDLNDVTRSLHQMLTRLVGEHLSLDLELADDLWTVMADPSHIEQVVANLVVNARDATDQGGAIILRTENVTLDEDYVSSHPLATPGDHVAVSVSDTGSGMTDEVKAHLFEPFFTTKPVGKGTGLGLATCYTIAERLGGHMGVYSEAGVGTTIRLYLPRSYEKIERQEEEATKQVMPRGTETVLLVEDETSVRGVVGRVLRGLGYAVVEAADGTEALARLDEGTSPDLMVTDLVMPRMGGRELAERVAETHPDMPVLFMSGYTDDVAVRKDLMEKGIPFIHKPFAIADLARQVRATLDESHA